MAKSRENLFNGIMGVLLFGIVYLQWTMILMNCFKPLYHTEIHNLIVFVSYVGMDIFCKIKVSPDKELVRFCIVDLLLSLVILEISGLRSFICIKKLELMISSSLCFRRLWFLAVLNFHLESLITALLSSNKRILPQYKFGLKAGFLKILK